MTLTVGSDVAFDSETFVFARVVALSVSKGVVVSLSAGQLRCRTINYDANLLITSLGAAQFASGIVDAQTGLNVEVIDSNKIAITYGNADNKLQLVIASIAGDTFTFGSKFDQGIPGVTSNAIPWIARINSFRFIVFYGNQSALATQGLVCDYFGVTVGTIGVVTTLSTINPSYVVAAPISPSKFIVSVIELIGGGKGHQFSAAVVGLAVTSGVTTEFESDTIVTGMRLEPINTLNALRAYVTGVTSFLDLVRLSGAALVIDQHSASGVTGSNLSVNTDVLGIIGDPLAGAKEVTISLPTFSLGGSQTPGLINASWIAKIDGDRSLCVDGETARVFIITSDIVPAITDWDLAESPEGIPGRDT